MYYCSCNPAKLLLQHILEPIGGTVRRGRAEERGKGLFSKMLPYLRSAVAAVRLVRMAVS